MHTVFFTIKRADQTCIARQREWLAPFGISPARYDLLFVIRTEGVSWMFQSSIRRALGVRASTISKMVAALERDGFVRRFRSFVDKRQVRVELTRKARGLLRRVDRKVIRPGVVWFALYLALYLGGEVGTVKFLLDDLRKKFLDRASFYFPWCGRTLFPNRYARLTHQPQPWSVWAPATPDRPSRHETS
jgi:DNA-binding MarR family transcriptional regulator